MCGEGGGRAEARPPAAERSGAIFNPRLGYSWDLVSGRWNGEKGRVPKAPGHLIFPVTFTAWSLGLGQL